MPCTRAQPRASTIRSCASALLLAIGASGWSGCAESGYDETSALPSRADPVAEPVAETPSGRALLLRGIEPAAETADQLIVQLARAPSAHLRAQLATHGFRELASLSSHTLLLERLPAKSSALSALPDLLGVTPFHASDRVSRELARELVAARGAEAIPLLIHVLPERDAREVTALLEARAVPVLNSGQAGAFTRVSALVPKADAAELATQLSALPSVFFVERVHHLGFFNDRSAGSVQSGIEGASALATPIWAHGLRGEGQIVGLIDSGLDVDSCFFADSTAGKLPRTNTWSQAAGYGKEVDASHRKIIAYDFLYSCDQWTGAQGCELPSATGLWDNHGHGTHCSGSMVGNRPGAKNNGMAPEAKIVVQDGGKTTNTCSEMPGLGCPVIDLYPIFEQAYLQGVRVHNNSYGDNEEAPVPQQSNYTARSQDVDRFMWDHKDMLIVFAAGNAGMNNRDFSVGSPSTNKNGLSVGSVRNSATSSSDDDLSSFSSRGWSADGRIKPDIMAPGCTVSAGNDSRIDSNNCSEDTGCGTSYAAPIAVGAAALVRQYFTDGFYPSGEKRAGDARTPSAALLKAMLLNGAVSLTGRDNAGQAISAIPSNEQGWGRIQLDRALLFQGATRKLYVDDHSAGFAAGSEVSVRYTLKGVSLDEPLKVTLVWTDYPGTPDSPPRAPSVSNLAALNAPRLVNDLDLTVQSGAQAYLGNAFAGGKSISGGQPDRRNNVEQAIVTASGDVSLIVKAASIAQGKQDFALVVSGHWDQIGTAEAPEGTAAMDAGATRGIAAGDGGRGEAGPSTQTVANPIVTGSSEAGAAATATLNPQGTPNQGDGGPSDPSGEQDAAGCACRVSAGAPMREGLTWLLVALWLGATRRRRA
jgi:Subtilase family